MLPRTDSQKSEASEEGDNRLFNSKRSIKHRLRSLRKRAKNETQMDYFMMDRISEEKSESCTMTIEVLKQDIRAKLLQSVRYLCVQDAFQAMTNAPFQSDLFRNASLLAKNYGFLWASYIGRLDYMQLLFEQGADVNFVYEIDNFSALHLSALNGSVTCCEWLLSHGCVFRKTANGLLPLHYAVFGNSKDVSALLIVNGCEMPDTVLNSAVYANAVDCVLFLLSRKIGVNTYDKDGMAPIHIASDHNNISCLRHLLEHPKILINLKTRDERNYAAIHLAAENGYDECIRILVGKGANVNEVNNKKETSLHLACKMQYLDCVEILLKSQAIVNAQNNDERTPLHAAVSKSRLALPIVQVLVKWHANVNAVDWYGFTPLHIAASNELEECVEYLIMNGANVAAKTNSGLTALNIINRKTPVSVGQISKRLNLSLAYNAEQSLKFSFRDLLTNSAIGEVNYLYVLQREGQSEVLKHPLCRAFLYLKWQKIRPYYLLRVTISILAVGLLSLYVMTEAVSTCCLARHELADNVNKTCPAHSVQNETTYERCSFFIDFLQDDLVTSGMRAVIIILNLLNIVRIFLSLAAYRSARHYFSKKYNILEIFITISIFAVCCNNPVQFTGKVQHVLGAISVLFGWVYLMIMVGQLPSFGTYVSMFTKVLEEFAKLLLAYLCLLTGFTMTLCILFPKNPVFQNPVTGFVKVMAMMTGELSLDELTKDSQQYIRLTSFFVLALFVMFVTVVLMNLLVGIAVHDVEGLHKTADLLKLMHQTQLIHFLELTCFNGFVPKKISNIFQHFLYVSPNMYKVVMYVRPLSPQESRIPRDIMEDGLKIALDRSKARSMKNTPKLDMEGKIDSLEKEVKRLQNAINALNVNITTLMSERIPTEPFVHENKKLSN